MTVNLEWGLQPPEGYEGVAWGARAIYSLRITGRSVIDLLWDRQCAAGDKSEIQLLCNMLDTTGLDLLREACTSERIATNEHRDVSVVVGDYIIHGNPRESCGYLYIVAYRRPCVECKRGVSPYRVYSGNVGPFCNTSCRELYLSRPTTSTLESYIAPTNSRLTASTPFEPSTIGSQPYQCNVPMCGESGVCAECRRRGAR